jgi:hypothetical protein
MKPTQLMTHGWNRVEFILSLHVDITSLLTDVSPPGDAGGLGGRFRYHDCQEWMHLALSAWEADNCPRLKLVLTLPHDLSRRPELANYALANTLNRHADGCAAYYDREAGALQIRSDIVYSGYQDNPSIEHDSSFEQSEATVNWMVQALSLGRAALHEIAASPAPQN